MQVLRSRDRDDRPAYQYFIDALNLYRKNIFLIVLRTHLLLMRNHLEILARTPLEWYADICSFTSKLS